MNEADATTLKRQAGEFAAAFVHSGMVVGLGTGSTAVFAVRMIARRIASGELTKISGVPTSSVVAAEASRLNVPLESDDIPRRIDVTIDGADEVDPQMNLIKGGGGALFREKIVAQASDRVVIVVDEGKLSPRLGTRHQLPVEVLRFGWRSQRRYLEDCGARVSVRTSGDGSPFVSDSGNMILDCDFGPIANPEALAAKLAARAGIVEHGLFVAIATDLVVAGAEG
ncbi:MAG: ribose-5-phosphate isomerase RpiA, partial [Acidobacteria bacterium]|nr:ribose-5-phosphate isomerase RpiA [Acidobacteriota bacterium]